MTSQMDSVTDHDNVATAVRSVLKELLEDYRRRVPDRGPFRDLAAGIQVHFGDPTVTLPGRLEIIVMSMDPRIDTRHDTLRFISVRVRKSREGGYASSTCLHGTKDELYEQLTEQLDNPHLIVERVRQLAEGLPEETDPDIWK